MLYDISHLREKQAMKYLQDLIVYYLFTFSIPLWDTLIAGAFVLVSLSSSFYLLFEHLSAYRNPEVTICFLVWLPCFRFWMSLLIFVGWLFGTLFTSQEQKFLIGVILMVPCYAVESVSKWLFCLIEVYSVKSLNFE
jgi:hypothetical protein